MKSTLRIEVLKDKTNIIYIDNGNRLFEYSSKIGEEEIIKNNFNEKIANDWMGYIIWCLESISYVDRVPEEFLLLVNDNSTWYKSVLSRYSYTQFFIKNKKPHVIIEGDIHNYERHKKVFSQFKI